MGIETYDGPYSDSSSKWTHQLKMEVKHNEADDGVFFVPIEVYKSEFGVTYVNYDTYNMCRTDFLALNDTHDKKGTGQCGENCTKHEFTLSSECKQEVIVSASVWPERSYPLECRSKATDAPADNFDISPHTLMVEQFENGVKTFYEGTTMFEPFEMEAGEKRTITVELNWTRPQISNDFSVVVWGTCCDVCIDHNDGLVSDKFL